MAGWDKIDYSLKGKSKTREEREVKQTSFDLPNKTYVDFMLRLEYDNFTKPEFLINMIELYLLKDEDMMKCVAKIQDKKTKKLIRGKAKRNYQEIADKEKQIKKDFGLDKNELTNIFDILEKEFSEK